MRITATGAIQTLQMLDVLFQRSRGGRLQTAVYELDGVQSSFEHEIDKCLVISVVRRLEGREVFALLVGENKKGYRESAKQEHGAQRSGHSAVSVGKRVDHNQSIMRVGSLKNRVRRRE